MKNIVSYLTFAGLMALSSAAAATDAQDRLGSDNVDYFRQSGQLGATYPTIAVPSPADPADSEVSAPSQRVGDSNYEYFDPKGAAAHGLTQNNGS